jgi:hypothetical protein
VKQVRRAQKKKVERRNTRPDALALFAREEDEGTASRSQMLLGMLPTSSERQAVVNLKLI